MESPIFGLPGRNTFPTRGYMTISKETKAFAINFFLPPTGALVVAGIAYLSGVKVTFAPFLPESLFRSTLDAFLLLMIAYVLFLGGQRLWSLGQATRMLWRH